MTRHSAAALGGRSTWGAAALAAGIVVLAAPLWAAQPEYQAAGKIGYNQFIRPILSDHCFYCHGPDKNHREGKFRLDDREATLANGAIVPGEPDNSELIRRIFSTDPDEQMPPPKAHKTLSAAQKDVLKKWIAQGAVYEAYWAYVIPKRPATPHTKNAQWVRNPIDAFILQALEARSIAPSREANRRTLLRRLSLDLIGLPPTPAEIDAFLSDKSPDAYEKQVDRLLASPHFGERMATAWLDVARYADTVGYHGDQNQNVFPYRDYVIDSLNKNKPFDQFTIEQLAGDLLPHPTTEQLIATGFNRLNMMTREGGAQPKEYLAKYTADRVRTVSQAFLGSTMGCCQCHDHKYDPFTTKDFYAMGAFFADVKQWGVYADYPYTPNPDLKGFNNDSPFPPELTVESPYLLSRIARLSDQVNQIVASSTDLLLKQPSQRAYFDHWRQATAAFLRANPTGWSIATVAASEAPTARAVNKKPLLAAQAASGLPPKKAVKPAGKPLPKKRPAAVAIDLAQQADGSVVLIGKGAPRERFEFKLEAGTIAALRVEALPYRKFGGKIVAGDAHNLAALTLAATLKRSHDGKETRLAIYAADADAKQDLYRNGRVIPDVLAGWKLSSDKLASPQTAVYVLSAPVKVVAGDRLVLTLGKNPLGRLRVSISPLAPLEPLDTGWMQSLQSSLAKAGGPGSRSTELLLRRTCLLSTDWNSATLQRVRKLQDQIAECNHGKSPTLVTVSVPPIVSRVLPHGNWQDESGEIVQPAPPQFLPGSKNTTGRRLTRLDLARWIVSPDNPLTSRAVMNRMWKQFFGNGISGVVEDLGGQGEWPSHPELLDYLAVEFRESGWDVKHMVRLMVTSSTYRQDSRLRPELRNIDPDNRLLSSQNPRRLEAEFVRDNALSIAGLINLDVGGPAVQPYQPTGYYVNLQFPPRDYVAEVDSRQYRRGIYMHWQRTFLHPMLANFDAPSREDALCTRIVSNTPQQALTLLNDPEFVESSRVLAQHVLAESTDTGQRLEAIYQRVLCRSPKPEEAQSLTRFLAEQRKIYAASAADAEKLLNVGIAPVDRNLPATELAAWTNVCRVVLNLHETITRY